MDELTVVQKAACWDKFIELADDVELGNSLMLQFLIREIKASVKFDEGE